MLTLTMCASNLTICRLSVVKSSVTEIVSKCKQDYYIILSETYYWTGCLSQQQQQQQPGFLFFI